MSTIKELIKLAENPDIGDLTLNKGEDDFDGGEGGDESGGKDDYVDVDEGLEMKGKEVSGPRTKLASMDDIAATNRLIGGLAKSIEALTEVTKSLVAKAEATELAKSEETTLSKDDATGESFDEKDSTEPANRPWDPTAVGEKDTVLNDAPSSGPGPTSKSEDTPVVTQAQLMKAIEDTVKQTLAATRINKSQAPTIAPTTKVDKSEDVDWSALTKQAAGLTFNEINRERVRQGDLKLGSF